VWGHIVAACRLQLVSILCVCLQEKFTSDLIRIIQYNAELTDESVAYTSHVASASARALLTKVLDNLMQLVHTSFCLVAKQA